MASGGVVSVKQSLDPDRRPHPNELLPTTTLHGNVLPVGDTLNINDQGDTDAHTYTVTGTTVVRTGAATVTYGTIETLAVNAGTNADTIDVTTTAASVNTTINAGDGGDTVTLAATGAAGNVVLNGQAGVDTINVQATAATSITEANGGTDNDTINVGDLANSLDGIGGSVYVDGQSHDPVDEHDVFSAGADPIPRPYNAGSVYTPAAPVPADRGDSLNIIDLEPMTQEQRLERREREIEDVLVVDRVELDVLD